uniref:N-acetylgalactosaminide beta-1,3-galactosyltransferase n=1 Tax=Drosophila rhopaloa TaxID=1041015 RepID=A0A6P4FES1_DRORH
MYRNILCLALGLIIGIRLTDFFEYFQLTESQFGSTALTELDDEATPQLPTEEELARWLYNETRVLCMVLTMPKNHQTRVRKVKHTWGKRCNKLIFISSQEDHELGAIDVGVPEDRNNLYLKMRKALEFVYKNYAEDYDWFLKADDDTQIGFCLQNVGVVAGDSRDEEGRDRFLPMSLKIMLPNFPTDNWIHMLTFYEPVNETGSSSGISFHYVKNHEFEMYEFLLYRLRVFGTPWSQRSLPPRLEVKQMQNQLNYWSQENSTNPYPWLRQD